MSTIVMGAAGRRGPALTGWVIAAGLWIVVIATAQAHGGALELTVSRSELAAGQQLTVTGEGFPPNATTVLNLTGPGGDADLGTVTTSQSGDFTQSLTIPGVMVPGLYLIRTEGAAEASVEISLSAMAGMTTGTEPAAGERDRSTTFKIALTALFGLVAAAGAWLVRPRHRDEPRPGTATEPAV